MVNKDTKICISIAELPGTFGKKFHNEAYEKLRVNFAYIPLKVAPNQLESMMQLVRTNFRGCSVSMPHKIEVMQYLNNLDESAEKVGAVNTILNEDGVLTGFNTDYYGIKTALKPYEIEGKTAVLLGAGGFARAIGYALKDIGAKILISNRTESKAKELADKLEADIFPWEERNNQSGYVFINATSVGMYNPENSIVDMDILDNFDVIVDAVVQHETKLQREAKIRGKNLLSEVGRTVYQGAKQVEIYTGKKLSKKFIEQKIKELSK